MNILGVKVTSHDTGAAILAGDQVIAIAEERLNRVKHSRNMFPRLAIEYCLREAKLRDEDIDFIVVDQVGLRERVPSDAIFRREMLGRFATTPIHIINHHDAHAASAFFCSPFDDAAVLVVDGSGEKLRGSLGMTGTETETLYRGVGNRLVEIQKTLHLRDRWSFPYTFGIGKLYSLICVAYLGLGEYNEGKMMGLAPYGDDSVLRQFPPHRWYQELNGHFLCNARIQFEGLAEYRAKKKVYSRFGFLMKKVCEWAGVRLFELGNGNRREFFSAPKIFTPIDLPRPARKREDPLPDPYYAAVAYAVQKVLEEVMRGIGTRIREITGARNLCMAGGVGLNIDANRQMLESVGFERLFVQPAASDTGIALGCVLYGAHMIAGLPRFWQMETASLGRPYPAHEIDPVVRSFEDRVTIERPADVSDRAAELVAGGAVVGWFAGGSEYGPRALGHRSILGDARRADMKDILNNKVKHREPWRPFAASVLAEEMSNWFELSHPSPFMLLAAPVARDKRAEVPSIVHVDGSCRIQSVTPVSNPRYYSFLKAFYARTGVPLVLNTSFNLGGDPIIETPREAIECFLKTKMDYLVLEDYVLSKKSF